MSLEDIPETFRKFCMVRAGELKLQILSTVRNRGPVQLQAQSRGEPSWRGHA